MKYHQTSVGDRNLLCSRDYLCETIYNLILKELYLGDSLVCL